MEFAREYYDCDDIQGVYLENEGGSGTTRLEILACEKKSILNAYVFVALIGKREPFIMK